MRNSFGGLWITSRGAVVENRRGARCGRDFGDDVGRLGGRRSDYASGHAGGDRGGAAARRAVGQSLRSLRGHRVSPRRRRLRSDRTTGRGTPAGVRAAPLRLLRRGGALVFGTSPQGLPGLGPCRGRGLFGVGRSGKHEVLLALESLDGTPRTVAGNAAPAGGDSRGPRFSRPGRHRGVPPTGLTRADRYRRDGGR